MSATDQSGEFRELPCRAADGARSTLRAWSSGQLADGAPVLLATPAMALRGDFYDPLATPLAEVGLRLVTMDLRGHGTSSVRPGRATDFGYRELLELDWPAAVATVRDHYAAAPLVLLGHSLGGQLSLLYAGANPGRVDAVVTVATGSIWWRAFPRPRRYGFLLATQFIAATAALLGTWPGHRLGFGGREARSLVADWAFQARTGHYRARGSAVDYEAALGRLDCPALLVSVTGDGYAPASAADHLAGKLPPERVTRVHLDDESYRASRNSHFGWVKRPGPVVAAIAAWLGERGIAATAASAAPG